MIVPPETNLLLSTGRRFLRSYPQGYFLLTGSRSKFPGTQKSPEQGTHTLALWDGLQALRIL